LGDTVYGGVSGTQTRLAGNISTWRKKLTQTGNGAASAAPTWENDTLVLVLTNGNQTTTSASAQAINDLISSTLETNQRYLIYGVIFVGCDNTGGVKIALDIPNGATFQLSFSTRTSSTTSPLIQGISTDATLNLTPFCTQAVQSVPVFLSGEVRLSSTAGTIQFMFAAGTGGQTATILQLGSFIILQKV